MSADRPVDLTIIVVSYNTCALTLACLDSIAAETRNIAFEVIVVDNASSDGSPVALRQHALGQHLIALNENIGFARANNLAALGARGEMILLLNPDTLVLDRAIERLKAFARAHPWAGIWGGRTVYADGRLNPSSCWARMSPWNLFCRAAGLTGIAPGSRLFNGEAYGGWQRDSVGTVDIVSGCFMLIRRSLWRELGGFDPAFFMYGEDADLCLRAGRLGARPAISPDATIVHHGGASEPARTLKMVKLLSAKAQLIRRHWAGALQPLGLGLLAAWPLGRWLALAACGRIAGRAELVTAARTWREIWRQRGLWLGAPNAAAATPSEALQLSTAR